jgi:hypothetical protein
VELEPDDEDNGDRPAISFTASPNALAVSNVASCAPRGHCVNRSVNQGKCARNDPSGQECCGRGKDPVEDDPRVDSGVPQGVPPSGCVACGRTANPLHARLRSRPRLWLYREKKKEKSRIRAPFLVKKKGKMRI